MRFNIRLSDKIIEINSIYQDVCELCRDYLYVMPDRQGNVDITVTITQADIDFKRNRDA